MKPTERFSNRVDAYVKYRPSYPAAVLDYLYKNVGFGRAGVTIADVGAGTGIFSKLLLQRGSRVMLLEPNDEMRQAARESIQQVTTGEARLFPGTAEETGLADASVDYIVCAQSFHWFDRNKAKLEFKRILKPGGKVVLVWNNRLAAGTPFREGYEHLLRTYGIDYERLSHKHMDEASLSAFFAPHAMQMASFEHAQLLDLAALKGRLLSSSYIPLPENERYEPMIEALTQLFEANQTEQGEISFDYATEVFYGII